MTRLVEYQDKYPHIAIDRTATGVLTLRIHRDDGPAKWAALEGSIHQQLGSALWHVARDPENYVVIFTGTGDSFIVENVPDEYPNYQEKGSDAGWDFIRLKREGIDLIMGFLELDRPLITIANGPAKYHSELTVLGDVVLAAEDAVFQDSHIKKGLVPSDGGHEVWLELLGTNRARHFLMTAQTLTAQQLLEFGVVAEVLPRIDLLPRALEIAEQWLKWSPAVLAYGHAALTRTFKRRLAGEIPYGLSVEGLGHYATRDFNRRTRGTADVLHEENRQSP
jgi:enoyl-CoA hydratase/carnithine racemase